MKKKKFATIEEAVRILDEAFENNPEESGRPRIAKKTIYNAMSAGRLDKHGTRGFRQVSVDQLLNVFGPKKAS